MSRLTIETATRLPYAMLRLTGAADRYSVPSLRVGVRDCLADQPLALMLDLLAVRDVSPQACGAIQDLARDSVTWPGGEFAVCTTLPGLTRELAAADAGPVAVYGTVPAALARFSTLARQPRESLRMEPGRGAPQQSRALVGAACERWRVRRVGRLAQLITSELVTNAVVHARTEITVTVRLAGPVLHVGVRDRDPRLLPPPGGGVAADGRGYGRGLLVVDSMADHWGCLPTATGKVAWATLRVPE